MFGLVGSLWEDFDKRSAPLSYPANLREQTLWTFKTMRRPQPKITRVNRPMATHWASVPPLRIRMPPCDT